MGGNIQNHCYSPLSYQMAWILESQKKKKKKMLRAKREKKKKKENLPDLLLVSAIV